MVYYATICWIAWLYGRNAMPSVVLLVSAVLHFHNGQYYASEANQNYGFRLGRDETQKKSQ